jgi:5'-deoxynucleotidase YfbR-like HD superfamily hydrolase
LSVKSPPPQDCPRLDSTGRAGGSLVGSCTWTFTGQLFDILAFDPLAIDLEDIAHGLSNICRFGGQTKSFYSVAQHSVLVSDLCDTADAQVGLLHDATEAYLGDMISPLKRQPGMEVYREIEEKMTLAVATRFGLASMETPSVELADRLAVFLEMRDLMVGKPMKYGREVARPDLSSLRRTIRPLRPARAKALFLARAAELGIS